MSRGAPGVPLVVFPAPGPFPASPHFGTAARCALDAALGALRELRRALRYATFPAAQPPAFECALRALRAFVDALPSAELARAALSPSVSPVHAYFGVRVAPLTAEEWAAQAATIAFRALADMRYAPVDVSDAAAEIEAVCAMLARFRPAREGVNGARTGSGGTARSAYEPHGDGLERWVAVHHLYFVLNLFAGSALADAARALASADDGRTASLLDEATTYVRGFSAAMVHSSAFSADYYGEIVRPTMQPPAVPTLLTGSMQIEHAAYRAALRAFLERLPQPFRALVRDRRALAHARDALLEADLVDIERHVCVAYRLVRDDHSLVQHAQSPENAVGTLRRMRHERASVYGDLVCYGDRLAGEAREAVR